MSDDVMAGAEDAASSAPGSSPDVDALADSALRGGLRIAVAESLTSGALASALGAGHDASTWFAGGAVTYVREAKTRVLGVDAGVDPCSATCARQLAEGVRGLYDADVTVSVTGIGGPDAQDGHPPGTVHVGLADAAGARTREFHFAGDPEAVIAQAVDAAIGLLAERVGVLAGR